MNNKQYKSIKEVSKLLNIKEHVIRHWDSVDPKTKKIRIQGISTRTKSGIRYFNEENIKKIEQIKRLLFENGKHNYSLDLVNKILSKNINKSLQNHSINLNHDRKSKNDEDQNLNKLEKILNNLRKLNSL